MVTKSYYTVYLQKMDSTPQTFGSYLDKGDADRTASLIRLAFISENFNARVQEYTGEVVECFDGTYRLKDTPRGSITLITERLTNQESLRLLDCMASALKLKNPKPSSDTIDELQEVVVKGEYHTVTLDFSPFDGSKKLIAGYYQTRSAADSVFKLIQLAHQNEKIAAGFDLRVESYRGNYGQYKSGRCYVQIGDKSHEVEPNCRDFVQVSKRVVEAIEEWSK